jgi:chromate reductase
MNKKIVAFGASSSRNSINQKLATYAAVQIEGVTVNLLDLNDFEMPIFSVDKQAENGIPQPALDFKQHILDSDGIIISFAEHNGAYSTAFKNIFDWISRIDSNVWGNKPMFLMATSPGARGGKTVLEIAVNKFKRMTDNTLVHFSLPSYKANFSEEEGITDGELRHSFEEQLKKFSASL